MKLRAYLRKHDLTLAVFAQQSKVEMSVLSRAQSGVTIPSAKTMRRIMTATDGMVMPNDFFSTPVPRGAA